MSQGISGKRTFRFRAAKCGGRKGRRFIYGMPVFSICRAQIGSVTENESEAWMVSSNDCDSGVRLEDWPCIVGGKSN